MEVVPLCRYAVPSMATAVVTTKFYLCAPERDAPDKADRIPDRAMVMTNGRPPGVRSPPNAELRSNARKTAANGVHHPPSQDGERGGDAA